MTSASARVAALLASIATGAVAIAQEPPARIVVVGDSGTVDWLGAFPTFIDPRIDVVNRARADDRAPLSDRPGAVDDVTRDLATGDVLLVGIGEDDHPASLARHVRAAERYVRRARERGALPVVMTPIAGRPNDGGRIDAALGAFVARERVAVIDVARMSRDRLAALGDGSVPHYRDDATGIACLVARGMRETRLIDAASFARDTDCGVPPDFRASRDRPRHASGVMHESDVATRQPAPHGGAGVTTAFPLFADAPALGLIFRKRVLPRGTGIGLHQHDHDEIYYVISGRGLYTIDGVLHEVGPGNGMLTRPGSSHALLQTGDDDLVVLINYAKPAD